VEEKQDDGCRRSAAVLLSPPMEAQSSRCAEAAQRWRSRSSYAGGGGRARPPPCGRPHLDLCVETASGSESEFRVPERSCAADELPPFLLGRVAESACYSGPSSSTSMAAVVASLLLEHIHGGGGSGFGSTTQPLPLLPPCELPATTDAFEERGNAILPPADGLSVRP
jgi:hypothetical protein